MWKKNKPMLVGLGSIFVLFLIYRSQNFNSNRSHNNRICNFKDSKSHSLEMEAIIEATPSLWRQFIFNQNDSSRIESQRRFIQRISKTDFIQSARPKKILLQDISSVFYYYFTNNTMKCPYARNFESRCELIEETDKIKSKGSFKYDGMDACVGIRTGGKQLEPIVPDGIQQIFYILEPPHIARYANLGANEALLSSFLRGSDIPITYREWTPNEGSVTIEQVDTISNKTKLVAALISNCNGDYVPNNRLGYIKNLKNYIEVDVYGRCGDLECPKDCLPNLGKTYKFYLAFENGNCFDYITEKFFVNALSHDMLPIVMGAQKENYESAAPPNSFIHVDDFESPKALAEYLHQLDKDDELYQKFFQWKGTGEITHKALEDFFCRACGMLFYADFVAPPKWESKETLFSDVNKCLPQFQWNWT